ncbi:TetR/AcrR family transcriptional regulator [Microbacterium aquimaris]|uniref:TetR/AcrR family transcriptional regulator n=1 Tax=Microbacterium aquimaris TaxID=459816 RepID=UPI002AD454D8|nr:TetR/AcrR family transcriptional regulator [Microbacterium aquimaris]MDZ8275021.1 TetR/AcrR family transcriptional regulator [Microbacterium aquimaris]
MARRGSYAKGVAKREEILERALDVIAREGFRRTSVKDLAEAVGLSQAGLLHYFGTKERLFTEILRKRDELDNAAIGPTPDAGMDADDLRERWVGVIRHNQQVPGLVHLFAAMSVDAADAEHPAHEYFTERNARLREALTDVMRDRLDPRIDPETASRLLQAVSDGLQLQWMLEPDLDMAATTTALLDLIVPPMEEPT